MCTLTALLRFVKGGLAAAFALLIADAATAQITRSLDAREGPVSVPPLLTHATGTQPTEASSPVGKSRRVALVVGNAKYSALPKLDNPKHDAEDMCAVLKTLSFEVACHYDIPTRSDFRHIIRDFVGKLDSDTVSLFYYAGHGVQINGENFLLPVSVDAKISLDMEDDSLNLSYLLRSLESAKSSPNIVILDACRNNPFKRTSGISTGLARIDPPVGTVLVYATAPNGVAIDGNARNGLFTKHLLARLPEPGRTLDELFRTVAQDVSQEAQHVYGMRQTPYRSFSFSGSYCLAGCEDPKVSAQIQLVKRQSEEAARRIQVLTEENERLRRQTEERVSNMQTLEARINAASREAASAGTQNAVARNELARLQHELAAAEAEQKASQRLKIEMSKREAEIADLKVQMAGFKEKASQLEEYRQRIVILERENADKLKVTEQLDQIRRQSEEAISRVQALNEENARLRRQAEERNASVAALEFRITQVSKGASAAGSQTASARTELGRLQLALAAARADQAVAESARVDLARRDQEINDLRAQIEGLQTKASQLEELRRQIVTLEQQNADQNRKLGHQKDKQVRNRPVIVPSF